MRSRNSVPESFHFWIIIDQSATWVYCEKGPRHERWDEKMTEESQTTQITRKTFNTHG